MPDPDKFDIELFKPKTKKERKSLLERGYFELSKNRAIKYFSSYRQLLPKGLNLDEVQYWIERDIISLAYCEKYKGEEINDICIIFKTSDSANNVWFPLGIHKAIFPPEETSIKEILEKYENKVLLIQKWKNRAKQRK